MTEATCAVLAAVFPLITLAVVVERRAIHIRIRKSTSVTRVLFATFLSSIIGIGIAVLGVQFHGLSGISAVFAWFFAAVSMAGLTFTLLASIATSEVEEDDDKTASI